MSVDDVETGRRPRESTEVGATTEPADIDETTDTERGDVLGLLLLVALVVLLGVAGSWWMVALVLAIVVCVFLHELGHYMTAKSAGMKVTEFFLGFGPKLWSFRRGETEYGVKAFPAGAYVRIIGMSNIEEVDPTDEERTYRAKPYWRRFSVAVAGSTMHFFIAFLLAIAIFVGIGVRDGDSDNWTLFSASGPAQEAGLQPGDRIVTIDGHDAGSFDDLSAYVRARPNETVTLEVERGDETLTLVPQLATRNPNTDEAVGYLGIGPTIASERMNPVAGFREAVTQTWDTGWVSVVGIGRLFSPEGLTNYYDSLRGEAEPGPGGGPNPNRPSSVVGFVDAGADLASQDFANFLWLLFAFNVFIGIFNLTPLLPFDGGHVVIATYEKIRSVFSGRRYQADVAKLMPLTYVVVGLLAALFLSSLWLDLTDPISFG